MRLMTSRNRKFVTAVSRWQQLFGARSVGNALSLLRRVQNAMSVLRLYQESLMRGPQAGKSLGGGSAIMRPGLRCANIILGGESASSCGSCPTRSDIARSIRPLGGPGCAVKLWGFAFGNRQFLMLSYHRVAAYYRVRE